MMPLPYSSHIEEILPPASWTAGSAQSTTAHCPTALAAHTYLEAATGVVAIAHNAAVTPIVCIPLEHDTESELGTPIVVQQARD